MIRYCRRMTQPQDATEVRFTAYQSGDAFTVWDHYTDTLVDDQMPCLESAEMLARLLTD